MLRMAGFQQVRGTYFNSVAFMPALVGALKERWRAKRNGGEGGEVVPLVVPQASERKKTILRAALNVEHSLIRRLGRLPFGVAILLEARKFA